MHPNDHVNRSQSSNDTFPTAVHVAVVLELAERLHPAIDGLCAALDAKADELGDVVKVGRTHLQDATPVTLRQEIGAWAAQVRDAQGDVAHAGERVRALAIGGTAVGTRRPRRRRRWTSTASRRRTTPGVPWVRALWGSAGSGERR